MNIRIGTSGYSYPAWKGSFYPEDLPAKKMLAYYASKLDSVEMNNTFYRMPSAKLVQSWAETVPGDFVFAVKAPQQITHRQRLKGSKETLDAVATAIAPLGARCGPILFQLPPFMKKDVPLLQAFLSDMPKHLLPALEFRHASWFADDTFAALRGAGAALCIADGEKLTTPLQATASWGYLRLRREDYVDEDLAGWAQKIAAQRWERAFVYFKHEDGAAGPRWAAQLRRLLTTEASSEPKLSQV